MRISASDETRGRNNNTSTDQTRLQASLMTQKHCAIRPHVPAGLGFRQGQVRFVPNPWLQLHLSAFQRSPQNTDCTGAPRLFLFSTTAGEEKDGKPRLR